MSTPISIFMMDVSNSTSKFNWNEVTNYLNNLEKAIAEWTKNCPFSIVKHRKGDEILFIAEGYTTAYIIAYYTRLLWEYPEQPPYFGMTFGDVEEDPRKIDIETWNHPLFKKTRMALETEKKIGRPKGISIHLHPSFFSLPLEIESFESTLNLLFELQCTLIEEQTPPQRTVCFLYSLFFEQKKIADLLQKTPATISNHFKKGKTKLITKTFSHILQLINKEETTTANIVKKQIILTHPLIRKELL
ncbi:sigma-70 family RNA polymerase sigma factor [Alkalihalobacterium bogoriense]|uniref:sigma-70 family RNA polymerase sigma factor n=1 Tax=Alkalihalobacterium bogoriense TaxID=246272 RepID=UPI00047C44F5|nr:sigma-70 family RNA polymerase sigma factor [Alkalihalobacterium bogoriense]